jgi:hypothetical protein
MLRIVFIMVIAAGSSFMDGSAEAIAAMERLTPHSYATAATANDPPASQFIPWKYVRYIGNKVTDTVLADNGRLCLSVPPRHGKSTLISHWTPTWFLDAWPHKRVMLCSYSAALAVSWGKQVRDTLNGHAYCRTRLKSDDKRKDRWRTTHDGGMLCAGVGGSITGFGADLVIIDDPHKDWAEAYSEAVRENVWEWFQGTLLTRLEPNASIIVLHTRWHRKDLIGHLLADHNDTWDYVNLPAIAMDKHDPLGRKPGQPLCADRYPTERLLHMRAGNRIVFDTEYQGKPPKGLHGRVYDAYSAARNCRADLQLRPDLNLDLSFDFNMNPGMHVLIGQHWRTDDRDVQFTAVHEIHDEGMSVERAMQAFAKWWMEQPDTPWEKVEVYGDPAGHNRNVNTGKTSYELIVQHLRALGIKYTLRVPRSQYHIVDRMHAMNDALYDGAEQVHYQVHPRCKRLIADFEDLPRDEDGLISKDEDKLSHASEAEANRVLRLRPLRGPSSGASVRTAARNASSTRRESGQMA